MLVNQLGVIFFRAELTIPPLRKEWKIAELLSHCHRCAL